MSGWSIWTRFPPIPLDLEDLLRRSPVRLDKAKIEKLISQRRVLITGAGGTIGSQLAVQVAEIGPASLILCELSELGLYNVTSAIRESGMTVPFHPRLCDVRDADALKAIFAEHRPEIVFHAAALKHVPIVESDPVAGAVTNVLGTRNVAEAASAHAALAFIQISTDKAVNATSVMGATKRWGEFFAQAYDLESANEPACSALGHPPAAATRFLTVRFGNVLGSSGSVVPLFQRQLMRGGPLTVTHPEIKRYFMIVEEAVALTLAAAAYGLDHPDERGQILVLDMGEPVRILDLARQVVALAGKRPGKDVAIRITGLRPGEKLFEELFDDSETPIDIGHPGLKAARPAPLPLAVLQEATTKLEAATHRRDAGQVVRLLKELVPGYRPAALSVTTEQERVAPSNENRADLVGTATI